MSDGSATGSSGAVRLVSTAQVVARAARQRPRLKAPGPNDDGKDRHGRSRNVSTGGRALADDVAAVFGCHMRGSLLWCVQGGGLHRIRKRWGTVTHIYSRNRLVLLRQYTAHANFEPCSSAHIPEIIMNYEEYRSNAVFTLLGQASGALEEISDEHKLTEQYSIVKEKIEYLTWIFEQSDSQLIGKSELEQVQNPLQQIVNHIRQNAQTPRRISTVDQWYEPIMAKFPYPRVRKIFRSERTELLNEFEIKLFELKARVEEVLEEANRNQDVFNSKIEELSRKSSSIEKSIIKSETKIEDQFSNLETRQQAEIAEKLAELNTKFNEEQTARRETAERALDKINNELEALRSARSEASKQLNKEVQELKDEAFDLHRDFAEESRKLVENIRELYGIAGNNALAGDFERAASDEDRRAFGFGILAVIFFIVAPIFFAFQWSGSQELTSNPTAMALKLTTAIAFLVPAAFFGSTSRRHHRVATSLRSLGIRVAVFDAYLSTFSEEERGDIKKNMAEVFFNSQITPDATRRTSLREAEKTLELTNAAIGQLEKLARSSFGRGS